MCEPEIAASDDGSAAFEEELNEDGSDIVTIYGVHEDAISPKPVCPVQTARPPAKASGLLQDKHGIKQICRLRLMLV